MWAFLIVSGYGGVCEARSAGLCSRNAYMLNGPLAWDGYDWWWHSLVARNADTGKKKAFFIEYYIINPARAGAEPVFGQDETNRSGGVRPSYAMIKAGAWGDNNSSVQIHNFYGVADFSASRCIMDVQIGDSTATETALQGAVSLSAAEAAAHPEYMSGPGTMSWDLTAQKVLSYSAGYTTAPVFRRLQAFDMYWHVAGMKTRYKGTITLNGQTYTVDPETSYGYQDKNWGRSYTNPWLWLNCNNFISTETSEPLSKTSLVAGGGTPALLGQPLGKKVLIAFYHEGELYEFNFTKFWIEQGQEFFVDTEGDTLDWDISAYSETAHIEISFSCPKSRMLFINYENPRGEKKHDRLWNGGSATGTVTLYRRSGAEEQLVDTFYGENAGCEWGEY